MSELMSELMKVEFGRKGPMVTKLGFGGIPIQTVSRAEAVKVVRYAYEKGIRFFDTARAYTTSEECIGEALRDVRNEVFIATKSGSRDLTVIKQDFEKSLTNLRTDRVDLFMFHNIMNEDALNKILADNGPYMYLKEEQKAGRVGLIGFSSHSADAALIAAQKGLFASVEFPFNYLEDQCLARLLPLTRDSGMGFIVMKPFAGGELSSASAALKWLYVKNVDVIIPGMMSCDQVDAAISAAKAVEPLLRKTYALRDVLDIVAPPLSPGEQAAIEHDRETLSRRFCRRCQYCLPCPNGISVNGVISMEQLFNRSGWHKVGEQQIATLKKALECTSCGTCEARCPYELLLASLVKPTAEQLLRKIEEMRRA